MNENSFRIPDPTDKPFLTVTDVCHLLQVSRPTAYNMLETGVLPAVRCGRVIRVPTAAVRGLAQLDADGQQEPIAG